MKIAIILNTFYSMALNRSVRRGEIISIDTDEYGNYIPVNGVSREYYWGRSENDKFKIILNVKEVT